ncbi:hypothetical protein JCM3765_003280 [Sporobolomyces pararoseus]
MESTSTSTVTTHLPPSTSTSSRVPPPPTNHKLIRYVSPLTQYKFPSLYSFPPFFTKQPNPTTWSHQRTQWIQLILNYSKFTKTSYLNLSSSNEICELELFKNHRINRGLSKEMILEILKFMSISNPPSIEFIQKEKGEEDACYVYWKTPLEWSETIYDWIQSTGQGNGTILTFYELTQEDSSLDFYKLPQGLLRKVLQLLQKQGKCQILKGTLGEEGDGVKFV